MHGGVAYSRWTIAQSAIVRLSQVTHLPILRSNQGGSTVDAAAPSKVLRQCHGRPPGLLRSGRLRERAAKRCEDTDRSISSATSTRVSDPDVLSVAQYLTI